MHRQTTIESAALDLARLSIGETRGRAIRVALTADAIHIIPPGATVPAGARIMRPCDGGMTIATTWTACPISSLPDLIKDICKAYLRPAKATKPAAENAPAAEQGLPA